ncbi:MAG: phosphotransferase [Chloroflexales bacterium]|nr:phosphotransferase [Chloroflexales bacterium]
MSSPVGRIRHDFTPWNLRFKDGRLSAILDFELAHWDHRIGDFALSWRGKYNDVLHGYAEVSLLESEEWALLTPLWWASLIDGACQNMRNGIRDDGWIIKKLLQHLALMGPDAAEFR